ncbi:unnamed protein product [Peronospora belbahrii]|uniref:GPI inositol-deacylase n=1 Tax=Peronospora belbahrii TaxID=622444 RepID=A0AAU9L5G0_9STRA|nr:unnamed protein product [Peronospora belbahrii]
MFANPVVLDNNKKVLYDVYAVFTQDNMLHNYTLVNGVGHSENTPFSNDNTVGAPTPIVKCFDGKTVKLPAINAIVAAVNKATKVSKGGSRDAKQCKTGGSYQTAMDNVDYAICVSGTTGFTMQSSDMDISVEYLEGPIKIVPPVMKHKKCSSKVSFTSVTKLGHALLTGKALPVVDKRKLRSVFIFREEKLDLIPCSCKSKPRPCIFIHGQGIQPEMADNQDSFPHYWGNLVGHAPCCSSMKYVRLDTIDNSWTSKTLQEQTCHRALAVSESSTSSTIMDTIVIAHSMGNLMLAGAIANGLCKLDSSSTWVAISGPMKGSMASDLIQDTCAGNRNIVLKSLSEIAGKCPPKKSVMSLSYEGGSHSSKELNAAYKAAQKVYRENVYALMCGESSSGLLTTYQMKFWLFGRMIPHLSDQNDGVVEFQSCAVGFPESKFGNTFRDRFYRTKLNHFDMEFLGGDSLSNEAKMPIKWFECLM